MLPGDTLTRDACLAYLASTTPHLHVGGKTALSWRGVRHNLAFRETIELWGDGPLKIPPWLLDRFLCRYQGTQIFDDRLADNYGLAILPNGHPDALVSVPERAMLELLSDACKHQTLEETSHLVEATHNLRESVLAELLAHVTRIKVVRLAQQIAETFELGWAPLAREHSRRLGGAARWIATSRNGERLELKSGWKHISAGRKA